MILPVYAYGQPVLKKVAADIDKGYEGLEALIANMWETMYNAHGVGLAAPQVGLPIRLFLVDTVQMRKEGEEGGLKQVFINAQKIEEAGEPWPYEEGCLSIPDVAGEVERLEQVRLRYFDEHFVMHERTFTEMDARVVQHEYDHIEGVLFTELLKPLKRRLIRRKLENVKRGNIQPNYKMKFVRLR